MGRARRRRIEVRELWVQDRVPKGALSIAKVKGEGNVADGLVGGRAVVMNFILSWETDCFLRNGCRHDFAAMAAKAYTKR